jgi:hypothetical protein
MLLLLLAFHSTDIACHAEADASTMQRSHSPLLVSNHHYHRHYLLRTPESLPSLRLPNPRRLPLPARVWKSNFAQHLPRRLLLRSNCHLQMY